MLPKSVPVLSRKRDRSATRIETSISVPAACGLDSRASERNTVGSGLKISGMDCQRSHRVAAAVSSLGYWGMHTEAVQLVCHLLYAGENLSQRGPCISSAAHEWCEQRVKKALARVVRAVDFYRVYCSGSLEVITELYEHMSVMMPLRPKPWRRYGLTATTDQD